MDHLNWELSVLNRSVAYNNLSGASQHVGLSQPQLSRIVAKLEDRWNLVDVARCGDLNCHGTTAKGIVGIERVLDQSATDVNSVYVEVRCRLGGGQTRSCHRAKETTRCQYYECSPHFNTSMAACSAGPTARSSGVQQSTTKKVLRISRSNCRGKLATRKRVRARASEFRLCRNVTRVRPLVRRSTSTKNRSHVKRIAGRPTKMTKSANNLCQPAVTPAAGGHSLTPLPLALERTDRGTIVADAHRDKPGGSLVLFVHS